MRSKRLDLGFWCQILGQRPGLGFGRPDLRSERLIRSLRDLIWGSERHDLEAEKPDWGSEKPDLRF